LQPLPEKLRAFVALRLSEESTNAIAGFIAELRPLGSAIRWTPPTNLHLTLRFLGGAVPAAMISVLDAELCRLAVTTAPFAVDARGTGAFPNLARPRVIWIGLRSEPLIQLAAAVKAAANGCGFAPADHGYVPHLTIGRVRELRGWSRIRAALATSADRGFGVSLIDSIILYRSVLGHEASTYEEIARYFLRSST
jgi:2'-5' RNA ligase